MNNIVFVTLVLKQTTLRQNMLHYAIMNEHCIADEIWKQNKMQNKDKILTFLLRILIPQKYSLHKISFW